MSSQGGKLFADLPAQAQDAMLWISKAGKIDLGASDATTFSKNALAEAPRRGCFRIYGGNKDMAG
ncbi:hypothetical protein EN925_31455 [Mesorhizobium sp. M7A.F.Ca.US.006.04.2.1]|uniref:hypothetical protein n=1 Tax=unclassified Mesorhizobium TaxID=325217 RepID=UPI000FCA4545|nr:MULTISPECIES: hypothetical protein [unclassified Mesorhizobium]RUY10188.1 hypothetical protein EN991_27900 [Mesorhizobium sp. M7A.F.Ca.US.005.03.2.1]RVA81914.1 hypothetical protein EN925_31455 [Mesorhizobium sp. M7A.F.Ca.US.006.04.2.1]